MRRLRPKWDRIMAIRDDVKKVLEQARADKVIGSALEAGLTLYCSKEVHDFLNAIPMDELADLFIVSHVDLVEGEGGVKGLVEGLGVSVPMRLATSACAAGSALYHRR